jgi:hypothetical protein
VCGLCKISFQDAPASSSSSVTQHYPPRVGEKYGSVFRDSVLMRDVASAPRSEKTWRGPSDGFASVPSAIHSLTQHTQREMSSDKFVAAFCRSLTTAIHQRGLAIVTPLPPVARLYIEVIARMARDNDGPLVNAGMGQCYGTSPSTGRNVNTVPPEVSKLIMREVGSEFENNQGFLKDLHADNKEDNKMP